MFLRSLAIAIVALACAACAANPGSRSSSTDDALAPRTVTGAPKRVPVAEYLAFLDTLSVAVENDEPRAFNQREVDRYNELVRQLRSRLEGVDNIDQLDEEQQVDVFNLHEELQAVVIGDPRYQVICRREQTVGTNFRRKTCMTVEELRNRQERAQDMLRSAWPYMGPPSN